MHTSRRNKTARTDIIKKKRLPAAKVLQKKEYTDFLVTIKNEIHFSNTLLEKLK